MRNVGNPARLRSRTTVRNDVYPGRSAHSSCVRTTTVHSASPHNNALMGAKA